MNTGALIEVILGGVFIGIITIAINLMMHFNDRLKRIEEDYITSDTLSGYIKSSMGLIDEKIAGINEHIFEIKKILDKVLIYKVKED